MKQTLIVSFVGDSSTAQVDLQKSKNEVVADGNDSATMTATVRDAKATCSMTSRSPSMLIQQQRN
ncbi:hypothetical protein NNE08_24220 [Escherichia coli]|nr:hypothetical protein [Escherichia coli]MCX9842522.1 hypothetical protein [Escherichia coli]MDG5506278.1 hypothetical protein [Escherichia coli]